jgi:radical SAM protein with 4Fe4S-binding SPASM domain
VVRESREQEMTTEQILSVIDQAVEAGCLYLLITGGDPMMRRDFAEIYRHARQSGLVVTVFADGVLVTDAVVELFRELPPRMVEISLYGATAETYETVTRVEGSYDKCLRGVHRLLDAGIEVGFKTVLMTVNQHELEAMRTLAEDLGVDFRIDAAIFPCLSDGNRDPLALRVAPAVGVDGELAAPGAVSKLREYVEKRSDIPVSDRLYGCGAGVTGFSVDPYGWASPCLMATHVRANLLERGLNEVWNDDLKMVMDRPAPAGYACSSCEMRVACMVCPAFNYLETGSEDVPSEYLCAATAIRWKRINDANPGGVDCDIRTATGEIWEGSTE